MIIIEMMIQKINNGMWEALDEIDKRYDVIESRHGFPSKRRLMSISGTHDLNTIIITREWSSMAAMEAAYEASLMDPEYQALTSETGSIIESSRMELYTLR